MDQEKQKLFAADEADDALGATQGARRASEEAPSLPDPQVVALAKRRRFTSGYKRRMLRAAAGCKAPSEVGALLRREGLYSSHLSNWRRELDAQDEAALQAKRRGPKPSLSKAGARKIGVLERDAAGWRTVRLLRTDADPVEQGVL